LTKTEILIIHYAYEKVSTHPGYPYTMPMKKLQHIRVAAFRDPSRIYERDTKGIEEHPGPIVREGLKPGQVFFSTFICITFERNEIFS